MKIIEKIQHAMEAKEPFYSFEFFPPKTAAGVENLCVYFLPKNNSNRACSSSCSHKPCVVALSEKQSKTPKSGGHIGSPADSLEVFQALYKEDAVHACRSMHGADSQKLSRAAPFDGRSRGRKADSPARSVADGVFVSFPFPE